MSFETIDSSLGQYYKAQGRDDYFNNYGIGKFLQYCHDNQFENDKITQELKDENDCLFLEFDPHFPYHGLSQYIQTVKKNIALFSIIRNCYIDRHHNNLLLLFNEHLSKKYCISRNQLSHKDINHARTIINQFCPQLLIENNKIQNNEGFLSIIALSKKCNIPLLTWFIDVHHKMIMDHDINGWNSHLQYIMKNYINYTPTKPYTVDITNYYFMNYVQKVSPKYYHIFKHIPPQFNRQFFQFPLTIDRQHKYDDDIKAYYDFTRDISNTIHHMLSLKWFKVPGPLPLQLDVWIIPRNVINDKHKICEYLVFGYSRQCPTELKQLLLSIYISFYGELNIERDVIGDITKKLIANRKAGLLKSYLMYKNIENVKVKYKLHELLRFHLETESKRYILIIDRRKNNDKKIENELNDIYYFNAPQGKGDKIHGECWDYLRCQNFLNSKECILPGDPNIVGSDIGLFEDVFGYMFGLSYHVKSQDSISIYWSRHGSAYRINTKDMRYLWPKYFVSTNSRKSTIDNSYWNEYWDGWKDIEFQKFYNISTGQISDVFL